MSINIDVEKLRAVMPLAKEADLEFYVPALNDQLPKFDISTELRVCHFLAQIAHESGSFKYKSENLNYSSRALRTVFGKYFPTEAMAEDYARKPQRIASRVYANRMGNGDESSGDGWKYRGRGLIQLTGHDNYKACSKSLGLDLVADPDALVNNAESAVAATCWYWSSRNLNSYADQDDVRTITKRINGGYNGIDDRLAFLARAKSVFNLA